MRLILGITRGEMTPDGYRFAGRDGDRLEIELGDTEYLHSVWLTEGDQVLLNLPLAVVPLPGPE